MCIIPFLPEKLIYSPAKTVNDMVDVATKLMEADVDLIVVDSSSALLPAHPTLAALALYPLSLFSPCGLSLWQLICVTACGADG